MKIAESFKNPKRKLPTRETVAKTMRANKAKDTKPELILRKALWSFGLRGYRLHYKALPGSPDIVFTRKKIAIFVHGCFWHRCPKCNLRLPKTNTAFWKAKFKKNKSRDSRNYVKLTQMGWAAITVWECEIKKNVLQQVETVAELIKDLDAYNITNQPVLLAAEHNITYGDST